MRWKQALICVVLATAGSVQASDDSSDIGCLFELSNRIGVDSQITVTTIRDKVFNGRLTSLDLSNQTLTFVNSKLDSVQYTLRADEMQHIRYRQNRSFKAGWAIGGFGLGTLAGAGVGAIAILASDSDDDLAGLWLVFTVPAGAVLGFILGAAIPAHDKDVVLDCP